MWYIWTTRKQLKSNVDELGFFACFFKKTIDLLIVSNKKMEVNINKLGSLCNFLVK